MTTNQIKDTLGATVICGNLTDKKIEGIVFATDLMSSVLAREENISVLITGLRNLQVIRTAEMLDVSCIILARGVEPAADMVETAKKSGILVMKTPKTMYNACGEIYMLDKSGED